jgi:hypothetical protein
MAIYLCNLLRFCPTYHFDDGSIMRRSSRESIMLERGEERFDIEFYFGPTKGSHVYYLPRSLAEVDRIYLVQKIEEYGEKKGCKILSGE